ncbi:MAG: macro domain-containing protein [Eubacterium sp.]|nr:macro domain-containing protein [Eubacterium sp.]
MRIYGNCTIIEGDITTANADVIVNAANGWGYMGGKNARNGLLDGVAESINRATDGKMEAYTIQKARKFKSIPSFVFGKHTGEIFISPPFGLNCKEVIHAVTMRSPGSRSKLETVTILANSILTHCRNAEYCTVAMPLLGTGTGGLDKSEVKNIILKTALLFPKISVIIYANENARRSII